MTQPGLPDLSGTKHITTATIDKNTNALFTLDVCVCVNVTIKFNIASMVTQMQTQRIGLNPFAAPTFALLLR